MVPQSFIGADTESKPLILKPNPISLADMTFASLTLEGVEP